jgi:hypothetical protein
VLYGSPVRSYVVALVWVALGALLYATQILGIALR